MRLIATLNNLAKQTIAQHPNVDKGGCCVVAAHIAQRLKALGVEAWVVTGSTWWTGSKNIDEIRNDVQYNNSKDDWESNGIDFAHVLVEFKWRGRYYAYDSTHGAVIAPHYWNNICWIRNIGSFSVEEAHSFAQDDGWNITFDRDQIPAIVNKIDQHLTQLTH